jgi:ankyrin repeat protein
MPAMRALHLLSPALLLALACSPKPVQQATAELEARGVTPDARSLYRSLRQGDNDLVELLVTAGVRPNLGLRRALEAGRCDALEVMVRAGYPAAESIAGAALLLAHDRGQGDCVAALRRAGVVLDGTFRGVVRLTARLAAMDQGAALRHAAVFGLSLDPRDPYGRSPLIDMVRRRSPPGVESLLTARAPLDSADLAGSTALHHALWIGEDALASRLLAAGADPLHRDRDGWDALAVAARTGSAEMVRALLARGVPPDARTRQGWTALALAEFEGHTEVVALLQGEASS